MATAGTIQNFLDHEHVHYTVLDHTRAYTAQEVAAATHVSGRDIAKTVMVKLRPELRMVVLPAHHHVSLDLLAEAWGEEPRLATEDEFQARFPGCELGAMPPFGNLFGVPVCVSEALTLDPEIVFRAGSHTRCIRIAYKDFARLVKPQVLRCSHIWEGPPRAEPGF
jgi:Ala-tRNA(Pro) deacylase